MKKQLLAAASIASIALAGLAFAAPAQALACGTPALLVNGDDGNGGQQFRWFSPTGDVLETVPLSPEQGYGDIALSSDAQTVYGVFNDSPGDEIDLVDVATGSVKGTLTITGPAVGLGGWIGAAVRPDGKLIIGNGASKVFTVDTTSGASVEFFDFTTLTGIISGQTTGDFVTLDNGDEIALATLDDDSTTDPYLVRIYPDGTGIIAGKINDAYGAGRVNGDLYLAGADGVIRKIALADIPTTETKSSLTEIDVVTAGEADSLWGAAGTQDSGTQTCPALPNTGVDAGALGALGLGLGLAGAAGLVIARRKNA